MRYRSDESYDTYTKDKHTSGLSIDELQRMYDLLPESDPLFNYATRFLASKGTVHKIGSIPYLNIKVNEFMPDNIILCLKSNGDIAKIIVISDEQ
jgi:hypothetical protein